MSLWYIGDPCYAIGNESMHSPLSDSWDDFCERLKGKEDALKGSGVEFNWHWIDNRCRTMIEPYPKPFFSVNSACACGCEEYFADCPQDKRGTSRVYVYNSGLGGDGQVNVHGYQLGVDTGMLSVLPIEVCYKLKDIDVGQYNGYAIVDARFRPVFDIDTDNFPHISLQIGNEIDNDTTGMSECDKCGEWCAEHDMTTDDGYLLGNDCCYEEKEEGEDL
jgi:hypothetical protein